LANPNYILDIVKQTTYKFMSPRLSGWLVPSKLSKEKSATSYGKI
jgi:hypothetical protein